MNYAPLDFLPLWGFFLIAALLLCLSIEGGYRLGRWRHSRATDEREQPVGAMVASILGLLALVLAFTFNLAATTFEARRQSVLLEANAIGTAYLRARLLPEPQAANVTQLLQEYIDVRIRGIREMKVESTIRRSEELHGLLWSQAVEATGKNPNSPIIGLFVQSLNDVIDLHSKRIMVGLRTRIPIVIWACLLGLAVLGMCSVGYQAGLSTTRRSPAMIGLVAGFVLVIYLIADLDRSAEGLFQTSQQMMIDAQKAMLANGQENGNASRP